MQTYPLKAARASQPKLSASACYNIWRETEKKKKFCAFLPVCIRSKCSMSKRGFMASLEEKQASPNDESMAARPGRPFPSRASLSR